MSFQVHPSFLQSLIAMFHKTTAFLEILRNAVWIKECGGQIHSENSELTDFFNCRTCRAFKVLVCIVHVRGEKS